VTQGRLKCWRQVGGRCGLALALVLALAGAAPHPDDAAIHARINEILSRPEFASNPPFNFWRWLLEKVLDLFRSLGALGATAPALWWTLVIVSMLALVALLTHITLTLRGLWWSRVSHADEDDDDDLRERRGRLSLAYREEALHCASQGDFTEAIRYLFLSLVYHFDEGKRVLFRKNLTNREYLGLFEDRPDVYANLKVFVDTLDERWYARRSSEPSHYESCLALYERLQ
jgi:hypothetical protein